MEKQRWLRADRGVSVGLFASNLAKQGRGYCAAFQSQPDARLRKPRLHRPGVKLVQADMSSIEEIERMFAGLGDLPLDFLINNAGIWGGRRWAPRPPAFDEMVNTNLRGPFWTTQCALRLLKDGGRIVNLSSVAGRIGVAGGRSLYGATKAAIDSLTRSWALELAPRKILVNSVAPGYTITDMTEGISSGSGDAGERDQTAADGEIGMPEDMADVVVFLCSEDSRFITGQSINVSGGSII